MVFIVVLLVIAFGITVFILLQKDSTNVINQVPNTQNNIVEENILINNTTTFDKTRIVDSYFKNIDVYVVKNFPNDISVKIANGKAYVAINRDTIGAGSYEKEVGTYYEIKGISSKVIDVAMIRIPTSGYPIFACLMENGTVEVTKFVENSDIVSNGTIPGYNNIVRIDNVEYFEEQQLDDKTVKIPTIQIAATQKDGTVQILHILEWLYK